MTGCALNLHDVSRQRSHRSHATCVPTPWRTPPARAVPLRPPASTRRPQPSLPSSSSSRSPSSPSCSPSESTSARASAPARQSVSSRALQSAPRSPDPAQLTPSPSRRLPFRLPRAFLPWFRASGVPCTSSGPRGNADVRPASSSRAACTRQCQFPRRMKKRLPQSRWCVCVSFLRGTDCLSSDVGEIRHGRAALHTLTARSPRSSGTRRVERRRARNEADVGPGTEERWRWGFATSLCSAPRIPGCGPLDCCYGTKNRLP
eukprot:1313895-Rhodomonas_salina.2